MLRKHYSFPYHFCQSHRGLQKGWRGLQSCRLLTTALHVSMSLFVLKLSISVLSFREKRLILLQLWAQTTEVTSHRTLDVFTLTKREHYRDKLPHSWRSKETENSRELGIVYSKIESSKAKQTREKWTTLHKKQDRCEWELSEGPQSLLPQAAEINHFKSQLYKRDMNQITATIDICCTVQYYRYSNKRHPNVWSHINILIKRFQVFHYTCSGRGTSRGCSAQSQSFRQPINSSVVSAVACTCT